MDEAKRARTAETPKQPCLGLKLRAPYFYPDPSGAVSGFTMSATRTIAGATSFRASSHLPTIRACSES
jgi:hypothetical protein